ncbi:choice-of-anchor L domain-containing protein [Photobacterium sp. GB-1]|uniref:PKD domain-containing protein n=1 Tax=Photobacterium sp. GB-1 TaxID=2022111 RepID=UPI000D15E496|nr:choice-of-anchor L domain-containing protein [Photobacterium sp. GB-1]PSV53614.1 hypothetical protein C9J45_06055 [Photobacterium sp. GB-1]
MNLTRNILFASTALALLGCGGGGSGESTPQAKAGDDIYTYANKSVVISSNNIDPNGTIVDVSWTQSDADATKVELIKVNNSATFTVPDIQDNEVFNFTVTVTDNDGDTATDDISVYAKPAEKSLSLSFVGLGDIKKVTNEAKVTLKGYVVSDHDIKQILVTNSTTKLSVNAEVDEMWSATIDLVKGKNQITVMALTADEAQVEIVSTINYHPAMDFTTPLTLSQRSFVLNEDAVTIYANIGTSNNKNPEVNLIGSGGSISFDEGADGIDDDGIYATSFSFNPTKKGKFCYQAQVSDSEKNVYQSEPACIWVAEKYTSDQVTKSVDIADSVETWLTSELDKGKDVHASAKAVVDQLNTHKDVGAAGYTYEGGIWWVNEDGILGLHNPLVENSKSAARSGTVAPTPVVKAARETRYYDDVFKKQATTYSSVAPANRIQSSKAVMISPYINNPDVSEFSNFFKADDYYGVWKTIKDSQSCKLFPDSEFVNNETVGVSLDSFKDFTTFGYIHFSTHGNNYFNGLFKIWDEKWGPSDFLKGYLSVSGLYTGIVLPKNEDGTYNLEGYESDLYMKRLAIGAGGALIILPSFFDHYLSTMPKSLVVLSACRSVYNNSLANVFLSKGAGAVIGYDDYVLSSYAQDTTNAIISDMLENDSTLKEAFDVAVNKHGISDNSSDEAFIRMRGEEDLKLSSGSFDNLSFEQGELNAWAKKGDGRIITNLGGTKPLDGQFVGVVSTGLGYTNELGSIEQSACLDKNVTTLNFDWKFYSEEFLEYCGTGFDDSFTLNVCEEGTTNCASFETSVNKLCENQEVLVESDVSFDQGGVYNTPWIKEQLDVSALANKRVKLTIEAIDKGDTEYDSAILIDNIEVK